MVLGYILGSTMIENLRRSEIRYAIYRCKNKCADEYHKQILEFYRPQFSDYGFDESDFAVEWDIDKKDLKSIVTGKTVKKYISEIDQPLKI